MTLERHLGPDDAHPYDDPGDRDKTRSPRTVSGGASRAPRICPVCDGMGTCRGCAQRRKHAWTLVKGRGMSVAEAARRMKLSRRQVLRFVALHQDWLELRTYKRDSVLAETALALFRAEQRRQPGLTRAEVAHRMGKTQNQLDRMLGLASTKGSAQPSKRRISIPEASELARALGRAPHELDGC